MLHDITHLGCDLDTEVPYLTIEKCLFVKVNPTYHLQIEHVNMLCV